MSLFREDDLRSALGITSIPGGLEEIFEGYFRGKFSRDISGELFLGKFSRIDQILNWICWAASLAIGYASMSKFQYLNFKI
jgi:hypothetical protein